MSPPHDPSDENRPLRVLHFADLETVYDSPEHVGRLAGRIDALRDESTLVVGAGDDTALGSLALVTAEGRAQARPFFEAVRPDAETFGNHDLDPGIDRALELTDGTPQEWLCANVRGLDSVAPSARFEVGGRRVGVVGVAHPQTAEMCGVNVTFTDPVSATNREAAALRERGAKYVVCLAHLGDDPNFAAAVDVDAVLCGHETTRRTRRVEGTLLVQTGGNGTEIAEVVFDGGEPTVTFHATAEAPIDRSVAATYRRRRNAAGLDDVVATVADPVERTADVRFGGECRLGNFVADAYHEETGADVGLVHSASLREGLPLADEGTVADVLGVVPFETPLVELELTGGDLRAALEWSGEPFGDEGGVNLHLSGARVRLDGGRIAELRIGGGAFDAGKTYRAALMNYLPRTEYFPTLSAENVVAERGPQYEAVVAHARDGGLRVNCDGRIRRG
ncbi:bifunctional metallophosphatase/5'-nucleotidase [Haladaptatus salinisoli]|uniref:bifunctional metallophosphatase/5'-nucleotidase n=1 Tax=Haladaptatus salinisoli TaxID=2884876 RepID=UPI001D0B65C2|nr:5'-nucleotidase C-terminal domain-containing protein [Haladaptatus salinisoli]